MTGQTHPSSIVTTRGGERQDGRMKGGGGASKRNARRRESVRADYYVADETSAFESIFGWTRLPVSSSPPREGGTNGHKKGDCKKKKTHTQVEEEKERLLLVRVIDIRISITELRRALCHSTPQATSASSSWACSTSCLSVLPPRSDQEAPNVTVTLCVWPVSAVSCRAQKRSAAAAAAPRSAAQGCAIRLREWISGEGERACWCALERGIAAAAAAPQIPAFAQGHKPTSSSEASG